AVAPLVQHDPQDPGAECDAYPRDGARRDAGDGDLDEQERPAPDEGQQEQAPHARKSTSSQPRRRRRFLRRPWTASQAPRIAGMSKSLVERRLRQVAERLRQLRDELDVTCEQLAHLADAADDAR